MGLYNCFRWSVEQGRIQKHKREIMVEREYFYFTKPTEKEEKRIQKYLDEKGADTLPDRKG